MKNHPIIQKMKPRYQNKKQLIRIALMTSPLFGMFIVAPILLYLVSLSSEKLTYIDLSFIKVTLIVLAVCSVYFIQWLINIGLLRFFSSKKKWIGMSPTIQRYFLSSLITIGFSCFFVIASDKYSFGIDTFKYYPLIGNLATNTFMLIIINLIVNKSISENLKLEKAQLEISHLTTQQEQLKQQIHPHFLFNALGTLQILIKKNSEKSYGYAQLLASFLRKSLTIAQNDVITVKEDLAFFEDYLRLQQMRFQDAIIYEVNLPEEMLNEGKIPVFSLQLLGENAIKHNSFSKQKPLYIKIGYLSNGYLTLQNNLSPKFTEVESAGIGLKNLTKRFSHFTNDLPKVEKNDDSFVVEIKILGL